MSDTTLNSFVASVADSTERLAFVPSPPTLASPPDAGYFLLQRDDNSSWTWDSGEAAWVPVGGGSGAPTFLTVTVTLTDAEVKALPTTPITIIPAPGAGFYINWQSADLLALFSAGAYTANLNTTYAELYIGGASGLNYSMSVLNDSSTTPAISALTRFFAAANRRVHLTTVKSAVSVTGAAGYVLPGQANGISGVDDLSTLDDDALVIAMDNNGSGVLTGGNAANGLKVTVYYTIEATT